MRLSARHIKLLGLAFLSLSAGMLNYYFFQSRIFFFELFPHSGHRPILIVDKTLRGFLLGYFSDIAWCTALYLVGVVLAESNLLQKQWKILILLLPVISEFAQFFHFIPGIFDWYDILVYVVIIAAFCKFFPALKW